MTDDNGGPYLAAALLCEKVLHEKDEVISIIRMIDRFTVTIAGPLTPNALPQMTLNFTAFLSFRAGKAKGRHTVKWIVETPLGIKLPEQPFPVLFEGEDRGINLTLALNLQIDQEGLYWFHIFLEDQFMTKIPLRIFYQRIVQNM
jgi:hypothetical protein